MKKILILPPPPPDPRNDDASYKELSNIEKKDGKIATVSKDLSLLPHINKRKFDSEPPILKQNIRTKPKVLDTKELRHRSRPTRTEFPIHSDNKIGHLNVKKRKIDGRVLLRKLEHGTGPRIEITWPTQHKSRQQLYTILTKCYGMKTAAINSANKLFISGSPSGHPWKVNMDIMSGFIREVSGALPEAERIEVSAIKKRHPNQFFKATIRIFPRKVDAALLKLLYETIGPNFSTAKTIRATYQLENKDVLIDQITVEGKVRARALKLSSGLESCSDE
ncbi:MAG: hypothetical protein CMM58_02155 [Rhodospirillaceae bacterium]|nr:hypothetical protein [Rhodospirillaceae bacterium]|tara:strand:+ start:934 stop:1767 length:834 start_codon:yes stop_codon:yes gene_type:complete